MELTGSVQSQKTATGPVPVFYLTALSVPSFAILMIFQSVVRPSYFLATDH